MPLHIGALHMSAKVNGLLEHSYDFIIGEKDAIERNAKNHRMKELVAVKPLPPDIARDLSKIKNAKIPSVNYWQEGDTLYREQFPRGIGEAKTLSKNFDHLIDLLATKHALQEHGATRLAIKYESPQGKRLRYLEKPRALTALHNELENKLRKR